MLSENHIAKVKQAIMDSVEEGRYKIPITSMEAMRFRGCGKKTLHALMEMGLVVKYVEKDDDFSDLHYTLWKHLDALGIRTKAQAIEAIKNGELDPSKRKPRHYGWSSHKRLRAFLGLPEPPRSVIFCPHCGKEFPIRGAKVLRLITK